MFTIQVGIIDGSPTGRGGIGFVTEQGLIALRQNLPALVVVTESMARPVGGPAEMINPADVRFPRGCTCGSGRDPDCGESPYCG
jgi:hypothetical protein